MYGLLRMILSVPAESRTSVLSEITLAIERHPSRDSIRSTLKEFWSHHSYVRVISEAGLPDEAFLFAELLTRAVRHLLPVDEVEGDLYVLMDSLNLKESDGRWLASLPDALVAAWAETFGLRRFSILGILQDSCTAGRECCTVARPDRIQTTRTSRSLPFFIFRRLSSR